MNPQTTIELASSVHRDRQRASAAAIPVDSRRRLRARVGARLVSLGNRLGGTTPRRSARRLAATATS